MIEGNHGGDKIAENIYSMLKEWKLRNHFQSLTMDNASMNDRLICRLQSLFERDGYQWYGEESHFRCLAHIINLATQDTINHLKETIDKLRLLFTSIKASPHRTEMLRRKCSITGENFLKPKIDTLTRWGSTFHMIQVALKMKNSIHLLFNDFEQNSLSQDLNDYELSSDQWNRLTLIKDFLQKFWNITLYLESDHYPTATKIIPLFNVVIDNIEDTMGKTKHIHKEIYDAAIIAWNKITKYYSKTNSFNMALATLDPRLNIEYLLDEGITEEDIEITKNKLREIYDRYSNKDSTNTSQNIDQNSYYEDNVNDALMKQVFKKRKFRNNNRNDMEHYMKEEQKDETTDPLEFWKNRSKTQPKLSLMARDFLGIPATSSASERLFSSCGATMSEKRRSMMPKTMRIIELLKSMENFLENLNHEHN
jgi:hypothetical protein